jgi:hypothetical protein
MKALFSIFFLLQLTISLAQEVSESSVKNSIYIKEEYLPFGIGQIGSSINYERKFYKGHLGIGTGFVLYLRNVKAIPIEISYSFFKKRSHLETGISARHIWGSESGKTGETYSLHLGYRYENLSKKGVNIKTGIMPGVTGQKIRGVYMLYPTVMGYFGIGYSF